MRKRLLVVAVTIGVLAIFFATSAVAFAQIPDPDLPTPDFEHPGQEERCDATDPDSNPAGGHNPLSDELDGLHEELCEGAG